MRVFIYRSCYACVDPINQEQLRAIMIFDLVCTLTLYSTTRKPQMAS